MKRLLFNLIICLTVFCSVIPAQNNPARMKSEALNHMQNARYGEAIDLLNKYIAANPQNYQGLYLRGLCYEKRGQMDNAALDLRRAIKLAPQNKEVQQTLWRVENTWKKQMDYKIEGHKRELAINPNKAVSYLEIGKAKKNLGKWDEAETWYDEYIKREAPSADEVIRYTEILAHNNHIAKGEKILKTYTEKYPGDQRLWSRYGYFTMWLGKYKIAIAAFEEALRIKPFFKEAQDGLDQAKGKAYIFTYTDTTARYRKSQPAFEYAIDKYYRIVRKNPGDHKTRFLLAEELYNKKRYEEAYEQLKVLENNYADNEKFQQLWSSLTERRDSLYNATIEQCRSRFAENPADGDNALKLAESYAHVANYDSAASVLAQYLAADTESKNYEARYQYAQYLAWDHQFDQAIEQIDIVLGAKPDVTKYKLLRAQISVWAVQELDLGEEILGSIIKKEPKNFDAILTMAYLKIWKKEFEESQRYLKMAEKINPDAKEIATVQDLYDRAVSANEEQNNFKILVAGRELAVDQKCTEAIVKYDEYLQKITAPNRALQLEYADVSICAKNYSKAEEIYTGLLNQEYDYDVAVLLGKLYLISRDTVKSLELFKKLAAEDSSSYDAHIYLGEAYALNEDYGSARDTYEELLKATDDSVKIVDIQKHLKWLPVSGFGGFLATFPRNIGFSPLGSYYSDNNNLDYKNAGGRLEFGISDYISIGAGYSRGNMKGNLENRNFKTNIQQNFSAFNFSLYLRFSRYVGASAAFGQMAFRSSQKMRTAAGTVSYNNPDKLLLNFSYESANAGLLLFSPRMLTLMKKANHYNFLGKYYGTNGLQLQMNYKYIDIEDGNKGNDLQIRLGRKFEKDILGGYEYYYSSYARKSNYYYTPQNFESHSLWADWTLQKSRELNVTVGAKVGYVPSSDFIIREISGSVEYNPYDILTLSAKLSAGGSYRYDSNYTYVSAFASAYLKIF
ncbi:MAG: tetratricopeptide repeat protein [Bacteroidota bacterium]